MELKGKKTSSQKTMLLAGTLLAVFSVFTFIGCLSFVLNWKEDQSLLYAQDFFADMMQVSNKAGGFGFKWSGFLVGKCFGLGAFILCAVLFAVSFRLIFLKGVDWVKAALVALGGTLLGSLALAYVASLYGEPLTAFLGGGIGGSAGSYLVAGMNAAMGKVVTPLLIVALVAVLVILTVDDLPRLKKAASTASDAVRDSESDIAAVGEAGDVEEPFETEPGDIPELEDALGMAEIPETAGPADDMPVEDAPEGPDVDIQGPEEELTTDIEEELPQLDIRSDVNRYKFPSLDLLYDYADKRFTLPKEEVDRNILKIRNTLASFKIPIDGISASVGYTVTLYKITLGEGVRVNQVKNLEDDIAIKIGIKGVRVVMLADAVGIEVPNDKPSVVPLKAILNSDSFRNVKAELPIALGYTITTKAKVFDLADAPHLLVAGATKQGKSVGLNAIISSLIYAKHPTELKFVFVDPKMVEFQQYSKLYKHYLAVLPSNDDDKDEAQNAIVKDPKTAEAVLRSLCVEMDERYKLMSTAAVNKITDYNEKYSNRHLPPTEGHHFMPYLVVVIDEYADLTKSTFGNDKGLSRSIENSIIRLAAKGRAAGLHVIIATQRPSVDVITGTIKSNFPTRLAFRTASRQDSMTILGITGAEKLIGKGDMLFFTGADAERVQCALVGSSEIDALTSFVAGQTGFRQSCTQPYYLPDPGDGTEGGEGGEGGLVDMKNLDPLFEEAARMAVLNRSISTSMIQRKMQLGFARAGRIMDQLESAGVVGPQQGSKPRESLVPDLASLQSILDAFLNQ